MARSTRAKIHRRLESVLGHYDKAIGQLTVLGKMFVDVHPEYSVIYGAQIEGLEILRDTIQKIRDTI